MPKPMSCLHAMHASVLLCLSVGAYATNLPTKTLALFNNSQATIYPVIEAPILPIDPWMQALFQVTDLAYNPYPTTRMYRAYLNPTTGGIPPGGSATVTVPFYSSLTQNPSGGSSNDQYVDWWNGMRVYLYDNAAALQRVYNIDVQHPVTLYSNGLACESGSVCKGTLPVYASNVGIPLNDPYQLTEYTFANVITSTAVPYPIDTHYVDYDLSYVDQVYLPVAMEPAGNQQVGYTGTTMDLIAFRNILNQYINTYQWPIYTQNPVYPSPRVPGAYNVLIGNQSLTQPAASNLTQAFIDNWNSCISDETNPRYADCAHVNALFQANYSNYKTVCGDTSALTTAHLLQNVYGWVSFACAGQANPLQNTPNLPVGESYATSVASYHSLEYSGAFNEYVQLIHSKSQLNMSAYAYSIDDAVGNMNQPGTGVVIAIGGSTGLPNGQPYVKDQIANINPGMPAPGSAAPYFSAYGICSASASNPLAKNTSFQVQAVTYPCEISLEDSNQKQYHFTLTAAPPYLSSKQTSYVKCESGDNWCTGIVVDYQTKQDINLPLPPQS